MTTDATEEALTEARATADAERTRAEQARATADAERTRAAKLERDLRTARDDADRLKLELDRRIREFAELTQVQDAEHANALDAARAEASRKPVTLAIAGLKLKAGGGRILNADAVKARPGTPVRVLFSGTAFDITPGTAIAGDVVRLVHSSRTYVAGLALHPGLARWWGSVRSSVVG